MFLTMCQNISSVLSSKKSADELDIEAWIHSQELIELKLLLHAFLLSNLVFLVQDTPQLDLQWLELLKNTATLHSLLSSQAEKSPFSKTTFKRLFEGPKPSLSIVFDVTAALQTHKLVTSTTIESFMAETLKNMDAQVRHLVKRPQFESLFQIASTQSIHVVTLGDSPMNAISKMVNPHHAVSPSETVRGVQTLRKWLVSKIRALQGSAHHLAAYTEQISTHSEGDGRRKKQKGSAKTLSEGYSLATSQEWFELSQNLLRWIAADPNLNVIIDGADMDPDFIFSEECCRHALEGARGTYFAGLPNTYGSLYHQKRVQLALRVFSSLARGPASFRAKTQFIAECTAYWNNGHRKCDEVSVTNRPCVHNYHLTKVSQSELSISEKSTSKITFELAASAPSYSPSSKPSSSVDMISHSSGSKQVSSNWQPNYSPSSSTATKSEQEVPIMPHSSDFKALHRCNCGKNQTMRLDPFDLEHANTTFFSNPECCRYLPSLLESQLSLIRAQDAESNQRSLKDGGGDGKDDFYEDVTPLAMPHSLRLVNLGWEATVMGPIRETLRIEGPTTNLSLSSPNAANSSPESHSSPSSIAKLSVQTGFVDGYSTLLPWIVNTSGSMGFSSSLDQQLHAPISSPSIIQDMSNLSSSQPLLAHIGLEYECHAGHRWFVTPQVLTSLGLMYSSSSPATGGDSSANDPSLDIQSILETSYIPIYTICTCAKKMAQLQRIYIATPRDPSVRITFNLFVQVVGKTKNSQGGHTNEASSELNGDESALKIHLDSGIQDHLILPQDQLVCLRLPYIYTYHDKPLLQGKMSSNAECRFFLEPRSFGLITT
jgi:hypothetical protein